MVAMGHFTDEETGVSWIEPLSDLDAWEEDQVYADREYEDYDDVAVWEDDVYEASFTEHDFIGGDSDLIGEW